MPNPNAAPAETAPRTGESAEYNLRRSQDPFLAMDTSPQNLDYLIAMSTNGIQANMDNGSYGETIEFATDLAYRLFSKQEHGSVKTMAGYGVKSIERELARPDISPVDVLRLQMRMTDLLTVESMSTYHINQLDGSPKAVKSAEVGLEAMAKRVIHLGVANLQGAEKRYRGSRDEQEKKNLRGFMFESLITTYRRFQNYEAENYDQSIVVGSTDFEDRALTRRILPPGISHNFDVAIMGQDGAINELIQCKSDDSQVIVYERPIRKVVGQGFHRFIDDPAPFLKALDRLVTNSADVTEEQMQSARELLDSLFEFEGEPRTRRVGEQALAGVAA